MPDNDSYGQGIKLALLSDAPDAQQMIADIEKIIGRTVMVFASSSNRGATLVGEAAPTEGMVTYLKDSNTLEFYNGSSWRPLQEAIPQLPRGHVGYVRYNSGTGWIPSTQLIGGTMKFTTTISTSRRYAIYASCVWFSDIIGAGIRFAPAYVSGSTIASNGSGTFELINADVGMPAVNMTMPISVMHEFNGPINGTTTFGLFATPTQAPGKLIQISGQAAVMSLRDIGPSI